ncbi:CubicO group peptidase (beta-lactamase class C family) [Actinoplanes octamycinicus]|uniref:CubicO group peptidase (Beta-lactamase class C family) n=1 Tax=Actinoplanes octamycinicus TaxID=135948 RepID=A0A7W7M9C7_9ACTN|nr:serine hydrolase domain-containing protein [Actinoplanes octamycinicus]MBB4741690.1 CubicO group peptidase (beta-lactamase class C family) [Actinoplanes octamycinicus]
MAPGAGGVVAGSVAAGADPAAALSGRVPPETQPGGAYDRYVARLAAAGKFSGVVLLSHRGRTVLSRSYGMADQARGIRNHEGTAFNLSSAGKPFLPVAVLQLAQAGRLRLSEMIGTYLSGYPSDIADHVTVHHLLSGTSRLATQPEDADRIFHSREEVREYYTRRARDVRLVGVPGTLDTEHAEAEITIPVRIVEELSGMTYWDYVQRNIFDRCGMTGSGFFTRPQWRVDRHLAHPYMTLADGRVADALQDLTQGSPLGHVAGKNPGRAFIDAPGDGGFATAPDLVRFANALRDGTLLAQPWADVLTAPKIPLGQASFGAYGVAVEIVGGQWQYQRAGGNPGIGANWSVYPDTGWVGVILLNRDTEDVSLQSLIAQETKAITGVAPEEEGPGG